MLEIGLDAVVVVESADQVDQVSAACSNLRDCRSSAAEAIMS